jgi:hypothetical protein
VAENVVVATKELETLLETVKNLMAGGFDGWICASGQHVRAVLDDNKRLRAELAALQPAPVVATDDDLRQALEIAVALAGDAIEYVWGPFHSQDRMREELARLRAILAASQVPAMVDSDPSMGG